MCDNLLLRRLIIANFLTYFDETLIWKYSHIVPTYLNETVLQILFDIHIYFNLVSLNIWVFELEHDSKLGTVGLNKSPLHNKTLWNKVNKHFRVRFYDSPWKIGIDWFISQISGWNNHSLPYLSKYSKLIKTVISFTVLKWT